MPFMSGYWPAIPVILPMDRPHVPSRVVVTGATGFIGSVLCAALVDHGYQVTAQCRRRPERDEVVSGGARWVPLEVRTASAMDWRSLLEDADVVIHLAARAHEGTSGQSRSHLRAINVEAAVSLAQQAYEAGIRRFVYLSSIGVLGRSGLAPLTETRAPAPADPYAWSKYEAERALWEAIPGTAMSLTVIRPPLVYGPNAPGNFGRLLAWTRHCRPLPLGGVTDNERSFVGLHNLVDFILRVLTHPQAENQVFHVADEETVSTAALLQMLARAAGHDPKLLRIPPGMLRAGARLVGRTGSLDRLLGSLTVDTRKAREMLGWRPPLSLEAGLHDAVARHVHSEAIP